MISTPDSTPKANEDHHKPQQTGVAAAATTSAQDAARGQSTAAPTAPAELASAKIRLYTALRRFADFPIPGINFIDIMPIFLEPATHTALLRALELQAVSSFFPSSSSPSTDLLTRKNKPDVVVGLDARGFLFGPSLALRLDAAFVPVRKKGKLPGPCVTASYKKEYGKDFFQMQEGAIRPGQKVLIVDDIIATGGSAAAAGELVKTLRGELLGYMFILEIAPLKGKEKLGDVPVVTLLEEA